MKILNPHEAAEYLGVAECTLRFWRSQGKGPPYFKLGYIVRYDQEKIDEWVQGKIMEQTVDEANSPVKGRRN